MLIRIVVIISLASLWACNPSGPSKKKGALSGYEYIVYTDAPGAKPQAGDQVYFNMDILDDKDSLLQSYRNQRIMPSMKIVALDDKNRAQNPILDILADLSVGDSVGLLVPIDSVQNLPPGFDDVKYLEYRIVAEEVLTAEEYEVRTAEELAEQEAQIAKLQGERVQIEASANQAILDYKAGKLNLQSTPGGVKYHIIEMGSGTQPVAGMMSEMLYYGALVSDGSHFDDSYQRGRGYAFRLGEPGVIEGWQEAAINFPKGTKAHVFIPAALGYGDQGSPPAIPGGAELYFYMEVADLIQ